MHRLTAVFYSGNNPIQTGTAVNFALENSDPEKTNVLIIDQGSEFPYYTYDWAKSPRVRVIRYEANIGGNAVIHRWYTDTWFKSDVPEFLAFFHVDLFIREQGWDTKVINAFDNNPKLMLQGFVGSNEIDERGGRGGGTMLNFLGDNYGPAGHGSPANHHGRRETGLAAAAVLDHCSLIFRSEFLIGSVPQEGNFAPEHFYDRHISCETLDRGAWIAVNGVLCDHINGGVGGGIIDAATLCRKFLDGRNIKYDKDQERAVTYVESEKDFHKRFLHNGFIPLTVSPNQTVTHQHVMRGGFWYPGWTHANGRRRVDGR